MYNTMAYIRRKKNRQTIEHQTQHKHLSEHQSHQKVGVILCALEGQASPAPHVSFVNILILYIIKQ